MSFPDAEIPGEVRDGAAVQRTACDPMRGCTRQARDRVDQRKPRRELGPAAHTWAKASALGRRGGAEESAVVMIRHACRAHGSAIDARRRDPDEENAIEACITRVESARKDIGPDSKKW